MSIKEIFKSSFYLEPLNEGAYEMQMHFKDDQGDLISKKTFLFSEQEHPEKGEIIDVYSQNGHCQPSILDALFERRDESAIQQVLKQELPLGPTVLVLDLQDRHTHYEPCVECHRQLDC